MTVTMVVLFHLAFFSKQLNGNLLLVANSSLVVPDYLSLYKKNMYYLGVRETAK